MGQSVSEEASQFLFAAGKCQVMGASVVVIF